jgi:hypothetical protein
MSPFILFGLGIVALIAVTAYLALVGPRSLAKFAPSVVVAVWVVIVLVAALRIYIALPCEIPQGVEVLVAFGTLECTKGTAENMVSWVLLLFLPTVSMAWLVRQLHRVRSRDTTPFLAIASCCAAVMLTALLEWFGFDWLRATSEGWFARRLFSGESGLAVVFYKWWNLAWIAFSVPAIALTLVVTRSGDGRVRHPRGRIEV